MIAFIYDYRENHEVEPICKVLPIAPVTYYDHLAKHADPARLLDRAKHDLALCPEIQRVFDANWLVYGGSKIWRQLRREGFDMARCTVVRLMKAMGLADTINACSKPRLSIVAGHGATSKPLKTQPSNGLTGSPTATCSSRPRTPHPPKPKRTTTQLWKLNPWPRN